eukprot:5757855-Ditylum_brightwellii.AAC.1
MGLIYAAITNDWPTGLAYKVVVALHKKYAPNDLISKVELRHELNAVLMKKEEDPTRLFEKLSGLQNRFNTATFQIATDDIIAANLEKALT